MARETTVYLNDMRSLRAAVVDTMNRCADHARVMLAWSRETMDASYPRRMFWCDVGSLQALAGVLRGMEAVTE